MRYLGLRVLRVIALVASGVAVCAAPASASGSSATRASAYRVRVVSNCRNAHYKPKTFIVSCGDGGIVLTGLRWHHWTHHYAFAVGTSQVRTCQPDCATGGTRAYAVHFKLTRPGLCSARGDQEFQRFTIFYPRRHPSGVRRFSRSPGAAPCG